MRYTRLKRQIEKGVIGSIGGINLGAGAGDGWGSEGGEKDEKGEGGSSRNVRGRKEKRGKKEKEEGRGKRGERAKNEKNEESGGGGVFGVEIKESRGGEMGMGRGMGMQVGMGMGMGFGMEKKDVKRKRKREDEDFANANANFYMHRLKEEIPVHEDIASSTPPSIFIPNHPTSTQFSPATLSTHSQNKYHHPPHFPSPSPSPSPTSPHEYDPHTIPTSQNITLEPNVLAQAYSPAIKLEPRSSFSSFSSFSSTSSSSSSSSRNPFNFNTHNQNQNHTHTHTQTESHNTNTTTNHITSTEDQDPDSEDEKPLAKRRNVGTKKYHASTGKNPSKNTQSSTPSIANAKTTTEKNPIILRRNVPTYPCEISPPICQPAKMSRGVPSSLSVSLSASASASMYNSPRCYFSPSSQSPLLPPPHPHQPPPQSQVERPIYN
ncbi:hypothetical protein OCU04_010845 [Sclerotinia nivalis]|uniref:Uncharacterized protein n=1 Tax=Sclerotinia nivalis TaxID=352851 RepID=A0A9X0DG74_9HELO|nr:hypothetical protein OCU04_010845 [Sclerotinia nivalis]